MIMITTKRAEYNTTSITVDAKWGINQSVIKKYNVVTDPAGENLIGINRRLNPNATYGNLFTDTSNGKQHWLQADV